MDNWVGKIAVVTGASSGIGAQIALALAENGLQVVALARRLDCLETLAGEAAKFSGKIHPLQCDISQVDSIESAFDEIKKKFGRVHIMINNAGCGKKGKLLDPNLAHSDYLNVINVNFSAAVICAREAFKLIELHDDLAFIININSSVGHQTPNYAFTSDSNVYAATKHAITNFTDALRIDLAHAGNKRVRVSSISPGLVKTDIFETAGYSIDNLPFNKMPSLEVKDISDAVLYLLSLPANVNVTEITIKGM